MSPDQQAQLALVEDAADGPGSRGSAVPAGELAASLGLGTSLLVGRYRVDLVSGAWWWSDEIYTMHGWKRHEVEPGLETLYTWPGKQRRCPQPITGVLQPHGSARPGEFHLGR